MNIDFHALCFVSSCRSKTVFSCFSFFERISLVLQKNPDGFGKKNRPAFHQNFAEKVSQFHLFSKLSSTFYSFSFLFLSIFPY